MNIEDARALMRSTQEERLEAREALQQAEATIESCQLIIQGLVRRFPELAKDANEFETFWENTVAPEPPRGADAVLSVLQVDENKWFTISSLVRVLGENDWLPDSLNPANAVRAAVERLVASPEKNVYKSKATDGTVIYRYCEPGPPPSQYTYEEEPF